MIDKLSDQEKSVMLARAMGWESFIGEITKQVFVILPGDKFHRIGELYDPANMALAWRVLNWASLDSNVGIPFAKWLMKVIAVQYTDNGDLDIIRHTPNWAYLFNLPPADAQRAWLDKILTLAIEAGMVDTSRKELT